MALKEASTISPMHHHASWQALQYHSDIPPWENNSFVSVEETKWKELTAFFKKIPLVGVWGWAPRLAQNETCGSGFPIRGGNEGGAAMSIARRNRTSTDGMPLSRQSIFAAVLWPTGHNGKDRGGHRSLQKIRITIWNTLAGEYRSPPPLLTLSLPQESSYTAVCPGR